MASALGLLKKVDRGLQTIIMGWSCALLIAMVIFTTYTVVMRYVFNNPPFWGDTVSVFANVWLVMLAYGLTVRNRKDIAMRGFYTKLPKWIVIVLDLCWSFLTLGLGVLLTYYGYQAANGVTNHFWELGDLPGKYPMLILPVSGVLVSLAAFVNIVEDLTVRQHRYRIHPIKAEETEEGSLKFHVQH